MSYPVWHVYVRGMYAGRIHRASRRSWVWVRLTAGAKHFEARVRRPSVVAAIAKDWLANTSDVHLTRIQR